MQKHVGSFICVLWQCLKIQIFWQKSCKATGQTVSSNIPIQNMDLIRNLLTAIKKISSATSEAKEATQYGVFIKYGFLCICGKPQLTLWDFS